MTGREFDWRTVYDFWFPAELETGGLPAVMGREPWWMQGGATPELPPFAPYLEAAAAGRLDHWAATPRGRLALIVVLDQFPRGLFAGTPRAFEYDQRALAIAMEGIDAGELLDIPHIWEQRFFTLPLSHAEGPDHLDRLRRLLALVKEGAPLAPEAFRPVYAFACTQIEGNIDVIARFGRFPHRNAVLGRASTPEELAYIEKGEFVHQRRPPYLPSA